MSCFEFLIPFIGRSKESNDYNASNKLKNNNDYPQWDQPQWDQQEIKIKTKKLWKNINLFGQKHTGFERI